MGVYDHPRQATSGELSPQLGLIRQLTPKYKKMKNLKFIDKVAQSFGNIHIAQMLFNLEHDTFLLTACNICLGGM